MAKFKRSNKNSSFESFEAKNYTANKKPKPKATPKKVRKKKVKPKVYIRSTGEARVSKILTDLEIRFTREKMFKDCINPKTKQKLRYDFYLPDYNLCIEYDGVHHLYKLDNVSQEDFESQLYRDGVKNKYCKDKGIELLRIPSKDFIRLSEIIKAYLSKLLS